MESSDKLLILMTTEKNQILANVMAEKLIRKKLAACVKIVDVNSHYVWNGCYEHNQESQLIIKTTSYRLKSLIMEIKSLHSYETPEIIYWNIFSSHEYFNWVNNSIDQ